MYGAANFLKPLAKSEAVPYRKVTFSAVLGNMIVGFTDLFGYPSIFVNVPPQRCCWAEICSFNFDSSQPIGIPMINGTVKFFNATKGFGFITPDQGGSDAFVHISAVEQAGAAGLAEGQKVSYDLETGRDGRSSATNLDLA